MKARFSPRALVIVTFLAWFSPLLFLLSSKADAPVSDKVAGVQPLLWLEKPRYVLGEDIRFWVGVKPKNSRTISEELQKPCSLIITRPDQGQEIIPGGWPIDGDPRGGWSGGCGLGKHPVEVGRYTLVYTCGDEKTPPVELNVDRIDILDKIKASFHFERVGLVHKDTPVPVVLTVQNNSGMTIRFPQRSPMDNAVWLRIVRKQPAFEESGLEFPLKGGGIGTISVDTYRWDDVSVIPSIVLLPGEHFEQRFLLGDAYAFDQAGDYQVTLGTTFAFLVGEKDGPFAAYCPLRLPVEASAALTYQ